MCLRSGQIKTEIIDNLNILITSAKQRETEQGINTFSAYIKLLNSSKGEDKIYKSLYHELSGMQRFAHFTNDEWQAVNNIFSEIESAK